MADFTHGMEILKNIGKMRDEIHQSVEKMSDILTAVSSLHRNPVAAQNAISRWQEDEVMTCLLVFEKKIEKFIFSSLTNILFLSPILLLTASSLRHGEFMKISAMSLPSVFGTPAAIASEDDGRVKGYKPRTTPLPFL